MSQICSNPKWSFSDFQPIFGGHFCYHSNHKNRINVRALGNAELRVLVHTFFSLGRMFFSRQEFRLRMFYSRHALKSSSWQINKHLEIKSPLILSIATRFSSVLSLLSVAILTGDWQDYRCWTVWLLRGDY